MLALPDDLSLRNNGACDHSVISEISERTGAFSLPGCGDVRESAAVRELLRAGGTAAASNGGGATTTASRTAPGCTLVGGTAGAATATAPSNSRNANTSSSSSSASHRGGGQQRRHHHQQSARSSSSHRANNNNDDNHGKQKPSITSVKSLLEDVRLNYAAFKASRCHHRDGSGREETGASSGAGGGVLRWIAEDAQFCGWYLCGIDTTASSARDDQPHRQREDANAVGAREARKKAAELAFLGREIEICGGGGGGGGKSSAFCVAL